MKKAGFLCVIAIIWLLYDRTHIVDMGKYAADVKVIEVKGAVVQPGVYEVDWNATVADVLQTAGGTLEEADTSSLNMARNIENEGVIVVGEKTANKKLSINTATAEELDALPGIGPSIAERIIAYRKTYGFASLDDLKQVKGIGDKLFAKLKDKICL